MVRVNSPGRPSLTRHRHQTVGFQHTHGCFCERERCAIVSTLLPREVRGWVGGVKWLFFVSCHFCVSDVKYAIDLVCNVVKSIEGDNNGVEEND